MQDISNPSTISKPLTTFASPGSYNCIPSQLNSPPGPDKRLIICLDFIQGACTQSRQLSPRSKNSPSPPMTLMTKLLVNDSPRLCQQHYDYASELLIGSLATPSKTPGPLVFFRLQWLQHGRCQCSSETLADTFQHRYISRLMELDKILKFIAIQSFMLSAKQSSGNCQTVYGVGYKIFRGYFCSIFCTSAGTVTEFVICVTIMGWPMCSRQRFQDFRL